MSNNTHYISGTGYWMKVLGDPVDNYQKDGKEWVFDLTPDAEGVKLLKKLKLDDRLKNKEDDRGTFFSFKQRSTRMDGSPNKPINVVDANGHPWDKNEKLGNGTKVDVKFNIRDYGAGKRMGVYPQAIRVMEHVEYESVDFPVVGEAPQRNEPDEFTQAIEAGGPQKNDLNDDPFDDTGEETA